MRRPNPNLWARRQVRYWDDLAHQYDQLYRAPWYQLEDAQLATWLAEFLAPANGAVLDLACGTGLGYELTAPHFPGLRYHGLDISPGMLAVLRAKHPHLPVQQGSLSEPLSYPSGRFRYVMCLNCAFSFSNTSETLLPEIHRVLEAGGSIFLSALNRWSLRRLIRLRFATLERYITRNAKSGAGVPALVYSLGELRSMIARHGFRVIAVRAQGFLAGVCEKAWLTPLESHLARWLPWQCHTLNIIAMKV